MVFARMFSDRGNYCDYVGFQLLRSKTKNQIIEFIHYAQKKWNFLLTDYQLTNALKNQMTGFYMTEALVVNWVKNLIRFQIKPLALSAPGYFCLIMPRGRGKVRGCGGTNAFDVKFGTVILCNVTKKWYKRIFKIAAIGMMASLIISIFLKNYAKNG